jgi:predicted TIM-barrel fold metal-dependent hydrolase
VLFGSHAPFYILESAVLKLQDAGLPEASAARVGEGNARDLLRGSR